MSPRILVVDPGVDFSTMDVHRGIVKGLRACGATVGEFSLTDRLTAFSRAKVTDDDAGETRPMFPEFKMTVAVSNEMLRGAIWSLSPDLVVVISGHFVNDLTLRVCRARNMPVCAVMTEQPYELGRELRLAEQVDHVAVNDPTNIDRFRERCGSVFYRAHAYDPDVHHPNGRTDDMGAVWVGTGYRSRIDWLERSHPSWPDGFDVHLGGNWQELADDSPLRAHLMDQDDLESCVDNADVAALYRRARMTWNTYRRESEAGVHFAGRSCGPREIEAAASGCFFARERRPESDELFPMLPTIDDPAELGEVMAWVRDHDDERREAAMKAAEAVADRTFAASAADLLARCGIDV